MTSVNNNQTVPIENDALKKAGFSQDPKPQTKVDSNPEKTLGQKIQDTFSAHTADLFNWKSKPWNLFGKKEETDKPSAPPKEEPNKTEEVGQSFFSKIKEEVVSVAEKIKHETCAAGLKLAKNLATIGYNPDQIDQENIAKLKLYTGTDDLPILIRMITDKVSDAVQKNVVSSKQSEEIKQFILQEKTLITQLINSALLNAAVNLASSHVKADTHLKATDIVDSLWNVIVGPFSKMEDQIMHIQSLTDPEEQKKAKHALLKPGIESLMKLAFPKGPDDIVGLNFGKKQLYEIIRDEALPEALSEIMDGYVQLHQSHREVSAQVMHQLKGLEKDGEGTSNLIEKGVKFLSSQIVERLKISLSKESEKISAAILDDRKNTPQSIALAHFISSLTEVGSASESSIWTLAQKQVETLLYKMISRHLEKHNGVLNGETLSELLLQAVSTLTEKLTILDSSKIDFEGLAKELLQKCALNLTQDLPSTFGLNKAIAEEIENKILPQMLSSLHQQTTSWMKKTEQNKEQLKTLFGTKHPEEACKVIGHYISNFAPWYLETSGDKAAEMIMSLLEKQIQELSGSGAKELLVEFQQNRTLLKTMIEQLVKSMGSKQNKESDRMWNFVKEYAEAASLEIFVRIATAVDKIQTDPNQKKSSTKVYSAVIGTMQKASDAFEGKSAQENGNKTRDFASLVPNLLANLNILNKADLPIPDEVKEDLWKLLTNEAVPSFVKDVLETLNESYVKDALILGLLKSLNESMKIENLFQKESKDEDETPIDPAVQAMDRACGDTLKKMVGMLPSSMIKEVFSNLIKMDMIPSETIGKLVRNSLNKTNLLPLIDQAIVEIIPHLCEGKWKGEKQNETFEPKNGAYHFELPKTPKEKAIFEAKKERLKSINRKKLVEEGSEFLSGQIASGISGFLNSIWEKISSGISKIIPTFKKVMNSIVNSSIVQFFIKGIQWLLKPIITIVKGLFSSAIARPALKNLSSHTKKVKTEDLLPPWKEVLQEIQEAKAESRREERVKDQRKQEILERMRRKGSKLR